MFGIDLSQQPQMVQTAAGYLQQGWDLAQGWLLSPAAWTQFGVLILDYVAAVVITRRVRPFAENLLNPGESTNIFAAPRRFIMLFLPLLMPLFAYALTAIGKPLLVRSLTALRSLVSANASLCFWPCGHWCATLFRTRS
jgi:hypothetical protein